MSGQIEMPKYKSHKEVWALKIKSVDATTVTPADNGYAPFEVTEQYIAKHDPKAGGYYVVYEDGYQSFSPADAFEGGYTLATRDAVPVVDARAVASLDEPVVWWNGFRKDDDERDGLSGPSFSPVENKWHDIPLYAGVNPIRLDPVAAIAPREKTC